MLPICAQEKEYEDVVFKLEGGTFDFFNEEIRMSDVLVELFQYDSVVYSTVTKNGKYKIEHRMDISVPFYLQFSKETYLSKIVKIDFDADSLDKTSYLFDTVIPFSNLDITMVFKKPFFENIDYPVVVAEFFLANKEAALMLNKAKKSKQKLDAKLSKHSGEFKFFYPNGTPKAILNIKNGMLEGPCSWWDEKGAVIMDGNFVNGRVQ